MLIRTSENPLLKMALYSSILPDCPYVRVEEKLWRTPTGMVNQTNIAPFQSSPIKNVTLLTYCTLIGTGRNTACVSFISPLCAELACPACHVCFFSPQTNLGHNFYEHFYTKLFVMTFHLCERKTQSDYLSQAENN